jgi:agmatine/peptidylarginine deiminase
MSYRLPAEWEKQDAVQFTFPHEDSDWKHYLNLALEVFVSAVEAILPFQKVIVVSRDIHKTKKLFHEKVIHKILFFELDSDDSWARDHGGITVTNGQLLKILDFTFNGWGLKYEAFKDDMITKKLSAQHAFNVPVEQINFVLEGGAIETDGYGTLLTTRRCMLSPDRNPGFSENDINQWLSTYLGFTRIFWLDYGFLAGDDTDGHIDTLVRFCNPSTLAYVKCTDEKDEHFEELRNMEKELEKLVDFNGNPYQLVPLPLPDACYADDGHRLPATYANFLIINGAVLLPVYGVKQDSDAVEIFNNLFLDRQIIPIFSRVLLEQHGSLHCITMQYPEGSITL